MRKRGRVQMLRKRIVVHPPKGAVNMTRTTISLHESTLRQVKEIARRQHMTLGETVTELLGVGLAKKGEKTQARKRFVLRTFKLGIPKVSLEDKDALYAVFDKGTI